MTPETAAASFHSIGSVARLSIVQCLVRAGHDGLSVGEIQARTDIAPSTLSHHIRVLAEAGVIEQSREGRTTVTRAAFAHLEELAAFILSECCTDVAAQKATEMAS